MTFAALSTVFKNHLKMRGDLIMEIPTIAMVITLFLLVLVLAMQFQIREMNGKMDQLLSR
jgi:FtsH-binding integral membrane protein